MGWFRKKPPTLGPGQVLVHRKFAEAISFAAGEWQGFENYCLHVDPDWHSNSTLRQRMAGFMAGPIGPTLEERFPDIATVGAEVDAHSGVSGHKDVILGLTVTEAIITSGTNSREEVEAISEA
jgi:hypothetical protein